MVVIALKPSNKEIITLHILRIAVIWGIVIYHGSILIQDRLGIGYPHFFSKFLYSGVDVLFVLSGFLLYYQNYNYIKTQSLQKTWIFLKKRAIRIIPLYQILTLGLVALYLIVPNFRSMELEPIDIIKSMLFWPDYWPILSVGWILSYQLYFYVLFSLLLLKKTQPIFWIIMSFSFILYLMNINLFIFNHFNLEFLFGLAGGYCYFHYQKVSKSLLISTGLSILALSVTIDILHNNLLKDTLRVLFYGGSSFFMIWGFALIEIKKNNKLASLIRTFSLSSYALFLSHYPLLAFLSLVVFKSRHFFILGWLAITCLAIFFGFLIYRYIEQPLTSFFSKRLITDRFKQL